MAVIAPSITVETAEQYKETIERIVPFAVRVHIDVSDGIFAPSFLLGESQLWWPKEWRVDVHAMVSRPSQHVAALIALNPQLITFHVEVEEDLAPILQQVKQAGIKTGVALLKQTVPSTVAALIQESDHVLIFSGDLGKYGGTASMMQLEKVRLVKGINPQVEIGWDGGVSIENARALARGGVDVLNTGGAIALADDPKAAYEALTNEMNKRSII